MKGVKKINLFDWIKKFHNKGSDGCVSDDLYYFQCEDDIEAALNYLDNHPGCTIEEYEEWLTHRENAMREIRKSKENND